MRRHARNLGELLLLLAAYVLFIVTAVVLRRGLHASPQLAVAVAAALLVTAVLSAREIRSRRARRRNDGLREEDGGESIEPLAGSALRSGVGTNRLL